MKYSIKGDPLMASRAPICQKNMFDTGAHRRLVTEINLINQHDEAPIFDGPVHLDVIFYFSRYSRSKKNIPGSEFYAGHPEIYTLLKWIQDVGKNIIFSSGCSFVSVAIEKRYSDDPRTEFDIRKL